MTIQIETLDQKLPTLSDKYKLAKTSGIIKTIEDLGFKMDKFVALKVRNKERNGFQKHRVVFTSPELKATLDGVPQLLLTNSHDGSSSVVIQLGFFRYVCSNGLVIGDDLIAPIRVRHAGNDFDTRLIAAINNVVSQHQKVIDSIDKLKSKILSPNEVKSFQLEALQKRLGADVQIKSFNVPVHRPQDMNLDLFTVMNVVQENLIRGGASAVVEKDGKTSNRTIRKVNSLVTQTEINAMLWNLAERMAA